MSSIVRDVTVDDASAICEIYNHYVENTIITFEEVAVSAEEMAGRIEKTTASYPWIVLEEDGEILGYAYVTNWRTRSAYRYSTECTIYLHKDATGRGAGSKLFEALLNKVKEYDIHVVMAAITEANIPSVKLHERFGFKKVGYFEETGYKFGRWIGVCYMELIID